MNSWTNSNAVARDLIVIEDYSGCQCSLLSSHPCFARSGGEGRYPVEGAMLEKAPLTLKR